MEVDNTVADVITRAEQVIPQLSPTAVRWTRGDCDALEKAGFLTYNYELVDGVINRMGQNIRHGILVRLILAWLFSAFGDEFVLTQVTIDVSPEDNPTNAPEPDAIVLTRPAEDLPSNPLPSDIRLCVEASDSTLSFDLSTKARLYARAGIREYWVLSVRDRTLHVHRSPAGGVYQEVTICGEEEQVSPCSAPDVLIQVGKLLPKLTAIP